MNLRRRPAPTALTALSVTGRLFNIIAGVGFGGRPHRDRGEVADDAAGPPSDQAGVGLGLIDPADDDIERVTQPSLVSIGAVPPDCCADYFVECLIVIHGK
jgi:hypothetical protein